MEIFPGFMTYFNNLTQVDTMEASNRPGDESVSPIHYSVESPTHSMTRERLDFKDQRVLKWFVLSIYLLTQHGL